MANQDQLNILKQGVEIWNQWRKEHPDIKLDLRRADLRRADLDGATLSSAGLSSADLRRAVLAGAYLSQATLTGATLTGAALYIANLTGAALIGTDLSEALCFDTVFADIDLQTTKGLESVSHQGPSSIDIRTLYRSQGNIPEAFLKGAGVDDTFIY